MDGYKLADALTPRQMSELAGLDYEVAEALYAAYAVDQNEYGKLISGLGDYKVPLFDMFMFLQREMKDGNITLDGDIQETLDDLFEQLNKAQLQLQSDKYSRLVVYLNLPEESDETMDFLDTMHAMIAKYYSSDTYIVGNSTNVKDLSSSFGEDNMLISVLSALFVALSCCSPSNRPVCRCCSSLSFRAVSGSTSRCRPSNMSRCTSWVT